MASVLLTSTAINDVVTPYGRSNFNRVVRAAENDVVGSHSVVHNPEEADIILFVDSRCKYHFDAVSSPYVREFSEKCFIFDSQDNSLPLLPGLYMGVPQYLHGCDAYRYGFYIRVIDNGVILENSPFDRVKYLFSFVGRASNSPVRSKVLKLDDAEALVVDRWSGQHDGDSEYAHVIADSKFVLCPRGIGPSTWRMFEVMRSGRCPVIISDQWRPPFGPKWEECSLIVPEADINLIPEILREREGEAERLGRRAWEEWDRHFSFGRAFNWIVDNIVGIQSNRDQWCAVPKRTRLMESIRDGKHRSAFSKEWIRELVHGRLHSLR